MYKEESDFQRKKTSYLFDDAFFVISAIPLQFYVPYLNCTKIEFSGLWLCSASFPSGSC